MDAAVHQYPAAARIVQTILWRRVDLPGHDACGLWMVDGGWRLSGTAVFVYERQPCQLTYTVACDAVWQTQSVQVAGWIGPDTVELTVAAVSGGRWRLNGVEQAQVIGCADVDLGFTPATNLIPLRRLALSRGETADVPAALLGFPEMTLARLDQQYRRMDDARYAYHAPAAGYAGMLEVSGVGFVTTYPGLWALEALM